MQISPLNTPIPVKSNLFKKNILLIDKEIQLYLEAFEFQWQKNIQKNWDAISNLYKICEHTGKKINLLFQKKSVYDVESEESKTPTDSEESFRFVSS